MSGFVYVPYPMMKWKICVKKWARARKKSLEPGPLYIFYGPQSFEKLYGSNANLKNRSYITVRNSLFLAYWLCSEEFSKIDWCYKMKNSVKCFVIFQWMIPYVIFMRTGMNIYFVTFVCGPERFPANWLKCIVKNM
jgi:hypothetical protein